MIQNASRDGDKQGDHLKTTLPPTKDKTHTIHTLKNIRIETGYFLYRSTFILKVSLNLRPVLIAQIKNQSIVFPFKTYIFIPLVK